MPHRPFAGSARAMWAAVALGAAATGASAVPAAAAPATVTFATIDDSGNAIRPPSRELLRPGPTGFYIWGTPEKVGVKFSHDTFEFRAPPGETLRPGTYEGATSASSRNGEPELSVSRHGYNCSSYAGRFVVSDIAFGADGALARFAATYEYPCNGEERALAGEVAYNVPAGSLAVYGSALRFPETYPRGGGRAAHVWLHNRGPATLTTTRLAVGGVDAAAFSVGGAACATVAPGAACAVPLRFDPPGGRIYTAALTITTSAGTRTVPLSGRGIPGHTAVYLRSELDDWTGAGGRYDYTPANSYWDLTVDSGRLFRTRIFGAGGEHDHASVEFEPPAGTLFAPGTYPGVRWGWTTEGPGLYAAVSWRACVPEGGSYTVHEAAYDAAGALRRLSLTFEARCGNGTDDLHGWVSWRATRPNVPPPGLTPPPVENLRAAASGRSARVSWDLPPGVESVAVRAGYDVVLPADGVHLLDGTATSIDVGPFPSGSSYFVSVFGVGANRHVAPIRKIRLRGTSLMVATDRATVTFGKPVTFRLALVDGETRAARPYQPVVLHARRPGGEWSALRNLTTDRYGRATFRFAPRRTYEYYATYAGQGRLLGSDSRARAVAVRPRVSATLSRTTVPRGGSVTLSGAVEPTKPGSEVRLQRRVDGAWQTLTAKRLSSASTYAFTLRPDTPGTWLLRAYVPADTRHAAGASAERAVSVT